MVFRLALVACFLLSTVSAFAQQPELICVIESDTAHTGFGRRILPLGDQNGDGYDDLIVADIIGRAYYFQGRQSADTVESYVLRFDEITSFMNNIGDVSGDSFDDFLLPRYVGGTGKLDLYYGGPDMDTVPDLWFGLDAQYGRGFSANGHDFNRDSRLEIISYSNDSFGALLYNLGALSDSVHFLLLTPANLQIAVDYDNFARSPCVGYFNGDGEPDLALGLRRHLASGYRGAVYFYWGGNDFDTIPDLIIDRPGGYTPGSEGFGGTLLEQVGDLNGDGFDDLLASAGKDTDDSLGFVFFGGPDLDTIPEVVIGRSHSVARSAGDINHDGYNDLIIGYPLPLTGAGGVYVYYGGPDMDSIADISFTNVATPGYQEEFGRHCSGVGDFNGDGLNDFAFSFQDALGRGFVLVYSGIDVNSVDYEYEPTLPSDYTLSHNFPNPFNPETNIQFALPVRTRVDLIVYNILGAEVTRLTEGTLSAGMYTVAWDGTDSSCRPVASGVYLYRLSAEGISITRKMILLK